MEHTIFKKPTQPSSHYHSLFLLPHLPHTAPPSPKLLQHVTCSNHHKWCLFNVTGKAQNPHYRILTQDLVFQSNSLHRLHDHPICSGYQPHQSLSSATFHIHGVEPFKNDHIYIYICIYTIKTLNEIAKGNFKNTLIQ